MVSSAVHSPAAHAVGRLSRPDRGWQRVAQEGREKGADPAAVHTYIQ